LVDHLLIGLDLFGHAHFAFAVQERDPAHFPQIHPDGIVIIALGLELFGRGGFAQSGAAFGEAFFRLIDDLDAILLQIEDDVIHLVQKEGTAGEDVVDLFEGDIAGFFAQLHQLFQTLVIGNHQCSLI